MSQLYSLLHYKFKDVSNNTSHAQIRVKMKKLWPRQVGEEKQATEHILCRDKANNKARNFVTTKFTKSQQSQRQAKDKLCCNKVLSVATKVSLL